MFPNFGITYMLYIVYLRTDPAPFWIRVDVVILGLCGGSYPRVSVHYRAPR